MRGSGYGDIDLSYICHGCGTNIDHNILRVAKFKKETENLIMRDWPLGGTIINPTTGAPDGPPEADFKSNAITFPNRLIAMELRSQVLELVQGNNMTMNDVKELIEKSIIDKNLVKRVNSLSPFQAGFLKRPERLAIRKMMSRYWENPSVGIVIS